MTSEIQPGDSLDAPTNPYPLFSPRFWHGMRTGCWWRLLSRNRFRMSLPRAHIAVGVSLIAPINDLLSVAQSLVFGRQIERTEIEKPPIFILGHWRSGTTLLHELLVTDEDFASPNTFQCFAPWHFLLSEPLMVRLGGFLLPKRRPMDNMEAGWLLPQEDEFALMNLGLPTPYLRIAFPQTQPELLNYLTLQGLSDLEIARWSHTFEWFLKVLTFHYGGKQLVLKSPTHTGRIGMLNKLYPDAKFIHLTREPAKLFSSSVRLWRSLEEVQALQQSEPLEAMEEYVTKCLQIMYAQFEKDRQAVDPQRIVDVRYEDLAEDPMGTVRSLYEQLELGDFSRVASALEDKLKGHESYQPNRHSIDSQLRKRVAQAWPEYHLRYGYQEPLPTHTR